MAKSEPGQRDTWNKIDVIIKAFGVLFISGALPFYAIYSENKRAETDLIVAQENTKFSLYADAMKNRQSNESAMKSNLMDNLVERILGDNYPKEKMLSLELLAYNFHETMDLKPLFNRVNSQIDDTMRHGLQTIAYKLKKRQIDQLLTGGAIREQISLNVKEETSLKNGPIYVELLEIKSNEIKVQVAYSLPADTGLISETIVGENRAREVNLVFTVGKYDFPFVGFFTIGKLRFSFV